MAIGPMAPDGSFLATTATTDNGFGPYAKDGSLRITIVSGGGSGGPVTWNAILGKPATYPPSAHTHSAADITSGTFPDARIESLDASKLFGTIDPSLLPPIGLNDVTYPENEIPDLTEAEQDEIEANTVVITPAGNKWIYKGSGDKTNTTNYVELVNETVTWSTISGKPVSFPPSAHIHVPSDVVMPSSGLVGSTEAGFGTVIPFSVTPDSNSIARRTFEGRVKGAEPTEDDDLTTKEYVDNLLGSPEWDDIQNKPSEFPPSVHSHDADDIISGQLPDARLEALSASKLIGVIPLENLPEFSVGNYVVPTGGTIASLTSGEQDDITDGTIVIESNGDRWIYKGTGDKDDEDSYIKLASLGEGVSWSEVTGKPTTFPATPHTHAYTEVIQGAPGVLGRFSGTGPAELLPVSSVEATAGSLARRNSSGNIPVGTPVNAVDATSKAYVDSLVASAGGITEAPLDGRQYARKLSGWSVITPGAGNTPEVALLQTTKGEQIKSLVYSTAMDNLVEDLKTTGLWSKLNQLYVFAGDGFEINLVDIKKPDRGMLGRTGASVFSFTKNRGVGMQISGVSTNQNFEPSSTADRPTLTSSVHVGAWIAGTGFDIGYGSTGSARITFNSGNLFTNLRGNSLTTTHPTTIDSHIVISRIGTNAVSFKDGEQIGTIASPGTTGGPFDRILALNTTTNVGSTLKFYHCGPSLTADEVSTLHKIFKRYLNTLVAVEEDLKLGSLADVDTTGATNGQVLGYNSSTQLWTPQTTGGDSSFFRPLSKAYLGRYTDAPYRKYATAIDDFVVELEENGLLAGIDAFYIFKNTEQNGGTREFRTGTSLNLGSTITWDRTRGLQNMSNTAASGGTLVTPGPLYTQNSAHLCVHVAASTGVNGQSYSTVFGSGGSPAAAVSLRRSNSNALTVQLNTANASPLTVADTPFSIGTYLLSRSNGSSMTLTKDNTTLTLTGTQTAVANIDSISLNVRNCGIGFVSYGAAMPTGAGEALTNAVNKLMLELKEPGE